MYSYKICALVVFLACVHYGTSLVCWNCVPAGDVLCDKESQWQNETCLLKVCYTAHGTANDKEFHFKGCGPDNFCDSFKGLDNIAGVEDVACAECTEDLCNSALTLSTTLLLPAMCLFAILRQYL